MPGTTMIKKIRLRHAGFVIGVILLLSGWLTRLVAALVLPGHVSEFVRNRLDSIGLTLSGASVFFLLGGIVFYAFMASKEEEGKPQEPLFPAERERKHREKLENVASQIKDSVPFTAVYGFMSLLIVLGSIGIIHNNDQSRQLGWTGLFVGLLLLPYYVRKSIRQFKWLSWYKKYGSQTPPTLVEEISVVSSGDNPILLRLFSDGTTWVLLERFPPDVDGLNPEAIERFEREFSDYIGVEAFRDDRERFVIMSNRKPILDRAVDFLRRKSDEWQSS